MPSSWSIRTINYIIASSVLTEYCIVELRSFLCGPKHRHRDVQLHRRKQCHIPLRVRNCSCLSELQPSTSWSWPPWSEPDEPRYGLLQCNQLEMVRHILRSMEQMLTIQDIPVDTSSAYELLLQPDNQWHRCAGHDQRRTNGLLLDRLYTMLLEAGINVTDVGVRWDVRIRHAERLPCKDGVGEEQFSTYGIFNWQWSWHEQVRGRVILIIQD